MEFKFKVSKSPTIHVTEETLGMLERLRQKMLIDKNKHKCYDDVIRFALKKRSKK